MKVFQKNQSVFHAYQKRFNKTSEEKENKIIQKTS